jgi:hypothetical protein
MQPRISELQRRKIDLFSVDRLINMLALGGMHGEVNVKAAALYWLHVVAIPVVLASLSLGLPYDCRS